MQNNNPKKQAAVSDEQMPSVALGPGRRRVSKVLPPGYSWLSVPLPTKTLNNLNIMARMSNLSLRKYMERFCEEAVDYSPSLPSPGVTPEQAPKLTGK